MSSKARPEDLLAKLTVLHNYVEKELQGVVRVVSDLLAEYDESIPARATTGRRLHAILAQGGERIHSALARQRTLLWEFCTTESNQPPPCVCAVSERGDGGVVLGRGNKKTELTVGSIHNGAPAVISCRHHHPDKIERSEDHEEELNEDIEWKRDTLVRMQYLLQRKAGDYSATEADRAASKRDMAKVKVAMDEINKVQYGRLPRCQNGEQVSGKCIAAPPAPPVPPAAATTLVASGDDDGAYSARGAPAPIRSEETARSTPTAAESKREARCDRKHGGRMNVVEEGRNVPTSESRRDRSAQWLRWEIEPRLPDGLDLLLRRIGEGVRPSRKEPPAAKPAGPPPSFSMPTQHRCNQSKDKRGDNDTDNDDGDDTEDTDDDDGDEGDDDRDNIARQLPRLNPSHVLEAHDGEGVALQTTTAPGKPHLLAMVGAGNRRGARCGKGQGNARQVGASSPSEWTKTQRPVGYEEDGVSDKGGSVPTAAAVTCCLLSARAEEERVAELAQKQRAEPKQDRTTAAASPAAAAGRRAVKGVASRALSAMNLKPVKMSRSVPSASAFGVHQSKPIFRRTAVGEALSSSGDKENRLGEA